jgi:hypothetical protein
MQGKSNQGGRSGLSTVLSTVAFLSIIAFLSAEVSRKAEGKVEALKERFGSKDRII